MKMKQLWIFVLSLNIITSAQDVDSFRPSFLSFITVKSGERLSLNCTFKKLPISETVVWYKQKFGEMPQKIGETLAFKEVEISPVFIKLGFTFSRTDDGFPLTIPHINKDHGGLYFCGKIHLDTLTLSNGTFVSVTGDEDVKVSVFQSSVSDSVPAGASVTLQCSVLSESRAAELQVLWFRAAPSQSHPQIIYTHHNSSLQCESKSSTHTCVYNLSKNIFSLNDTGTYYCAVVLCGKIIFGNGTRVQLEDDLISVRPEVICLTAVVVVCVIVICVQAFIICKIRNCEQSGVRPQKYPVIKKTPDQKNTNEVMRKREDPEDYLYTEVLYVS
ncbi:uncharacterized protein LOC124385739 isoform X1 [Silurus meridionalis]|uniref:uncharacterized protein LOC124385739 isoform X1 n=1 Tax=Silurus meridionalis TaxID=175797 RepID=UPI001EEB18BD|nr:uncharacterized protein LOC124385739 isoform X1 [Silurus meridionalis]